MKRSTLTPEMKRNIEILALNEEKSEEKSNLFDRQIKNKNLCCQGIYLKRERIFSLEIYIELFLAYHLFTSKVKAQNGQKNGSYVKINVCT